VGGEGCGRGMGKVGLELCVQSTISVTHN
jgi:hypothetical protein